MRSMPFSANRLFVDSILYTPLIEKVHHPSVAPNSLAIPFAFSMIDGFGLRRDGFAGGSYAGTASSGSGLTPPRTSTILPINRSK